MDEKEIKRLVQKEIPLEFKLGQLQKRHISLQGYLAQLRERLEGFRLDASELLLEGTYPDGSIDPGPMALLLAGLSVVEDGINKRLDKEGAYLLQFSKEETMEFAKKMDGQTRKKE